MCRCVPHSKTSNYLGSAGKPIWSPLNSQAHLNTLPVQQIAYISLPFYFPFPKKTNFMSFDTFAVPKHYTLDISLAHDEWLWDNSYCFQNKGMWNTIDLSCWIKNGLHGSVSSVAACCHRSPFVMWTSWAWLLCCSEVPVTQCWPVRLRRWMKQTSVRDPGTEDLENTQELQ